MKGGKNVKSEKGVSLILLILIVGILIAISFWGIKNIKEKVNKETRDEIEANMLSIQALAKNIRNKHEVNQEENALIGLKLDLENNETGYQISDELKQELKQIENSDIYILTQDDLNNNGLSQIKIDNKEFYVIDYNAGEVYYSLGIDGKYSLTKVEPEQENNIEKVEENEGAENEGTGE